MINKKINKSELKPHTVINDQIFIDKMFLSSFRAHFWKVDLLILKHNTKVAKFAWYYIAWMSCNKI